jgi:hypothetical protein
VILQGFIHEVRFGPAAFAHRGQIVVGWSAPIIRPLGFAEAQIDHIG